MKVNKKLIFGLLVLAAFSTFFWSTSSIVVAENTQSEAKSDQFWIDNQGYVDQILYKVITNEELLVEATRTGTVDIAGAFVDVGLLKPSDYNDPNLGLTTTKRRGFGHVTFNNQKFPTSIRGLRQGFAYALDKEELQQRALGGASFPADSPIVATLGVWSCEYEYAETPCSPTGETYYDPQVTLGNTTVLNVGFYDYDNDGYREFFKGNLTLSGDLIWSGSSVAQGNIIEADNGYADPNWDGYTYLGEDGKRRTFAQANKDMTGGDLGPDSSGPELLETGMSDSAKWDEVSFTAIGSSGLDTITQVITLTSEAFYAMGINVDTSYITFAKLLQLRGAGDFHAIFYAFAPLAPDPTFLQNFDSSSTTNYQETRWYNKSYDALWDIVDTSSDFETVQQASFDAQQMLWQEQPRVVMYNNLLTSLYRVDKFDGWVTVPGAGAFTGASRTKVHLKNTYENWQEYPNYPLGGTYVYGLTQPMDSRNSMVSSNSYTFQVLGGIEEALFDRNPETLAFIPSTLASNWTIQKHYNDTLPSAYSNESTIIDGTKFTFNLKENVTWHDGEPFTSEDVKYSFTALKTNISPTWADSFTNIPVDRINATTPHQVVIYSNSSGLFEFSNTGVVIYQKSYWSRFSDVVNHDNPVPQGTGPYKWVSSNPLELYLLERNDAYYHKPTVENFLKYYEKPDPPVPTTTTGETSTEEGGASPGFEILVTLAGMMAVSVVFIKLRRR